MEDKKEDSVWVSVGEDGGGEGNEDDAKARAHACTCLQRYTKKWWWGLLLLPARRGEELFVALLLLPVVLILLLEEGGGLLGLLGLIGLLNGRIGPGCDLNRSIKLCLILLLRWWCGCV
mgnify:CR=1 FL=1